MTQCQFVQNAGPAFSKTLSSWNFLHQDTKSSIYQCDWL
uniref:Uncharacterized protein n=1 Tax=Arundo donax TaxID=35708 RepID=A0A0A9H7C5_ARUDO